MPARTPSLTGRLPLRGRRLSGRQAEVLDALEGIFTQEGLSVTVGDLARRVGCSRRTLYELAPSKEELFLLVLDRLMRRLGKTAREAAAMESAPEKEMEAFLAAGVAGFRRLGPAFMEVIENYQPAGWLFEHHLSLTREVLIDTMEEGISSGRFQELHPGLAADVLLVAVRRATEPQVLEANDLTAAEALEELFRLVVHGLAHPAPRKARRPRSAERAEGEPSREPGAVIAAGVETPA